MLETIMLTAYEGSVILVKFSILRESDAQFECLIVVSSVAGSHDSCFVVALLPNQAHCRKQRPCI